MKKTTKLLALLLALLMIVSVFAGCGKEEEAPAEEEAATEAPATEEAEEEAEEPAEEAEPAADAPDTIVVMSSGAFQGSWDPTKNSILSNKHLEFNVIDTLYWYDTENNMHPNLAESWEYLEDGVTLQVKLKQGVKFHDGSDFDAEDVKASVEYITREDSSRRADYGVQLEGEVVDQYTCNIRPSNGKPLAALQILMAHDGMLSADDIANGTLDNGLNATGPYKFVKYENETVYLEAFEDYHNPEKAAKTKYVEYKYCGEASTRMAAVQAGEAQVIERVDIEQIPVLEADENVVVTEVVSEEQRYIVFKCTQEPMDNQTLRVALATAIDRNMIVDNILGGKAALATSYVPAVSNTWAEIDYMIQYDAEKAAELLAEAGYPNGEGLPTLKYITSTGLYPKSKEIGEYVASCWTALGVPIELVVEETAMWEAHLYEEDSCHITDTGWMNCNGDGNAYLGNHYRTRGRVNFSSYEDIDAILDAESQAVVHEERMKIIEEQLFPRLVETCTNFPMYDSVMVYAHGANVSGVTYYPNSQIRFADIYYV